MINGKQEFRFSINCPKCGASLKLRDADLGSRRACPKCQHKIAIPELDDAQRARAEWAKREFAVVCRLCSTRFYARPDQIGKTIACPDCHTPNTIARPAVAPRPARPVLSETDEYALQPTDDPIPVKPSPVQFRVMCKVCESIIYFRSDQVGNREACPDCGSMMIVPPTPPPRPVVKLDPKDPGIGVAPAADRLAEVVANTASIMEQAREKVVREERTRPKPPKRPFWEGVLRFPFYLRSLPGWIAVSLMGCMVMTLLVIALETQGKEMIVGMFVFACAMALFFITAVVACVYWMAIVNGTALGFDEMQEGPPFEMLSYLRNVMFFIISVGVSVAPGAILALILPVGHYHILFAIPSWILFFPFVFLSMLDAESLFTPYTRFVHESFNRCRVSWGKLYLWSLILLTAVAIPQVASFFFEHVAWQHASVVILVLATTIYFRLIGRLAWVIDRDMARLKSEEAAAEAELEEVAG